MVEEQGRIVAQELSAVWVETVRATACQSCAAKQGCGHAVMDRNAAGSKARIRINTESPPAVGSEVVVGIPEGALLKGAALVYLLPLVLLFIGALVGAQIQWQAGDASVLLGLLGLFLGFIFNRFYSRVWAAEQVEPKIIRVLNQAAE